MNSEQAELELLRDQAPTAFEEAVRQLWPSVVKAKTNLTGRIRKVQVGEQQLLEAQLCGKRATMVRPYVYAQESSNANVTRHAAIVLPIKPYAAKMRFLNAYQSGAITMQGAIASASSIADDVGNSLTWTRFPIAGANTASVPAGTNGNWPSTIFGSVDSDLITIDPAAYDIGTVLMYRTHALESHNTFLSGSMAVGEMTLAAAGMCGKFQTGVDAVTTPAGFTTPTLNASMPPVALILYAEEDVIRVAVYGSSTPAGTGDTTDAGWANRAQKLMSTDALAYIFACSAVGGATTQSAIKRFDSEMALGYYPDIASYNPFSSNDSDLTTSAALSRLKGQALYFIDECRRRGIVPILQTAQASTGQSGTTLTNRRSINQFARDLAAGGNCRCFDVAGLLTDETAATGTWKDLSLTADGTHPNPAGHTLIAQLASTVYA